ncbi:proton pump-interactor 1 [Jatropha curcas]|uniref:proton pump-interactor 1 n=1 Tax=Jatropha curcas TaxID=180498 RepID=UPI0005FBA2F8|nr:proton pump-interactor 1 [Jatropha curcas]XP_012084970.1 proton pump-interactor 1 [Jatropha curcas]
MGVEVVGSEMAHVPVETVAEVDNSFLHEKENGKLDMESGFKEPIKFGSQDEEPAKEADIVADAKFPKEAADEWPAPRQIHTFYFVRYRPFDDPKIKAKIDSADREIQRTNQSRFQILEELKAKRSVRAELMEQVKTLRNENDQYRNIVDEKRKEIEPLQQALGKLRSTNNAGRGALCSSEEELNDVINGLRYCIEHESIPLTEEKKILREIKQLEGTRDKVIANAAMRAKIQDSLGQKEAIQDQVKLMGVDLDGVRKEKQAVGTRIGLLKEKVKALDAEIKSLQDDLEAVTVKRDKAFENIKSLRQQRDDGNVHFYNSRKTITEAKDLAAKKDVQALEKLAHEEVDKFVSLWSSNKAFRDDYEKRILPSLDMRQLSRDGRIRNPDEKPLVVVESAVQSEPEPVAKPNVKRVKEEPKPAAQKDIAATQKAQKESSKTGSKATSDHIDVADEIYVPEKRSPAKEEIDESKLKELKREEEMVKAKQALERKKKLAEKAAAKAAIRAQKEAEKKLKEREKKLKKKAAISAPSAEAEEPSEAVVEAAETEKVEVDDEPPAPSKERVRKENSVRYRTRPKGPDSLPKAILRKKKTTNYWMWAAVAALLLLVFAVTGYYYLH